MDLSFVVTRITSGRDLMELVSWQKPHVLDEFSDVWGAIPVGTPPVVSSPPAVVTPPAVVPPSETAREPESETAQDIRVGSSTTPPVGESSTTSESRYLSQDHRPPDYYGN